MYQFSSINCIWFHIYTPTLSPPNICKLKATMKCLSYLLSWFIFIFGLYNFYYVSSKCYMKNPLVIFVGVLKLTLDLMNIYSILIWKRMVLVLFRSSFVLWENCTVFCIYVLHSLSSLFQDFFFSHLSGFSLLCFLASYCLNIRMLSGYTY